MATVNCAGWLLNPTAIYLYASYHTSSLVHVSHILSSPTPASPYATLYQIPLDFNTTQLLSTAVFSGIMLEDTNNAHNIG